MIAFRNKLKKLNHLCKSSVNENNVAISKSRKNLKMCNNTSDGIHVELTPVIDLGDGHTSCTKSKMYKSMKLILKFNQELQYDIFN